MKKYMSLNAVGRVELYVEGHKVGDARRCDKNLNARTFGLENYEF